jgi:hypothetical protein
MFEKIGATTRHLPIAIPDANMTNQSVVGTPLQRHKSILELLRQ